MSWEVQSICIGKAAPFRGEEHSAINKQPIDGMIAIGKHGIAGDDQADRINHGGPDMAIHLYPLDHHQFWQQSLSGELDTQNLLSEPGCFGSNLAVAGIDEDVVNIGDRFRFGTALLEISRPRQPCWKLEHRFKTKGMVATILRTGKAGWYFRILEEGQAQPGQMLERVEVQLPDWSVARVFRAAYGKEVLRNDLQALADMTLLADNVRQKALKRLRA